MQDVWMKFTNEITTTGLRQQEYGSDKKGFPCFTLCAMQGFKNKGFHFTEAEFFKQTFAKVSGFQNIHI